MARLRTTRLTQIADRVRERWARPAAREPSPDLVSWLEGIEARLEHLERAHEGLQDAVYRQSQLEDEHVKELRRKTDPSRIARDLSEDARKRGL